MDSLDENPLDWKEFIELSKSKSIKIRVSRNKGHWLMQSEFAPKKWRNLLAFLTYFNILLVLCSAIILLISYWWIPVIMASVCIFLTWLIRWLGAKAVLETSLQNEMFYTRAIMRGALILYQQSETKGQL
jgi:hypothetical protein